MQYARLSRYGGLALLAAVLVIGPFFKGLFFWTELLIGIAMTSTGFGLWALGRRMANLPVSLSGGLPGVGLLALLLCYLLQFAWAVYTRGNLDWVLRVAAVYFAFVMIRAEAGPALRRVLAWLLVLSAAGLTIPGVLEYTRFFAQDEAMSAALSIVNLEDRMATLLQYPNTAAIFFMAAVLAAIGLAVERRSPWLFSVMAGLISLISVAFFFTVSRGAVVALPFGLALLLIGLDNPRRWASLVLLGTAWAPSIAVLKPIGDAAAATATGAAFGWIAIAVVTSGVMGFLAAAHFLRLPRRVQLISVLAALLLAVVTIIVVRPDTGLLPKQAARLLDMNFRTGNVLYRIQLDQDALKMISDRPLGYGGWGWDRTYHQYQSTHYIGRETHNHYLQTGVEAGVLGLLVLVGSMGAALWLSWQNRKGDLAWPLAAAAGLVAGHSIIDFNLSYGAVWLWFWVLLAASAKPATVKQWASRPTHLGLMGATLGLTGLAVILAIGSWQTDRAERLAEEGERDQAVVVAQRARRFDPLSSAPLLVLDDPPSLKRAAKLDPQNAQVHWQLAVVLPNQYEWEGALAAARSAVQRYPLETKYHTKLFDIAGTLMLSALHEGDLERARDLATELRQRGDAFKAELEAQRTRQGSWMRNQFAMAPEFKLRYGQALVLTGAPDTAEPLLKDAARVGLLNSEADLWLYVLYEKRGDAKAMASLESKPWIRFRNANPAYKVISSW